MKELNDALRGAATAKHKAFLEKLVPTVAPEASLEEAMRLMTERRTRHLPVVEGERVVGVVSIGDLVKAIITHQGMLIAELSRYVSENR